MCLIFHSRCLVRLSKFFINRRIFYGEVFLISLDKPLFSFVFFSLSDAMSVHCLLMMNRIDLAGMIVRKMQAKNEDALSCQLASAEFYLVQVNDII